MPLTAGIAYSTNLHGDARNDACNSKKRVNRVKTALQLVENKTEQNIDENNGPVVNALGSTLEVKTLSPERAVAIENGHYPKSKCESIVGPSTLQSLMHPLIKKTFYKIIYLY